MYELCLCGVGGDKSLSPDHLREELTQDQLIGWLAFYKIRPFGTKRDDLRAAMQTYWQVSCSVTEAPEDHSPEKYMLKFDDGPQQTEAQQILQRIKQRMAGGT